MKKIIYIFLGIVIAITGTVYALNVSVPQSQVQGSLPIGLTSGNYTNGNLIAGNNITISTSTIGQIQISASTVGTISTSTIPTVGQLSYWTSAGYPSLLGSVGTSTISASSPLTGSFTQIGSGGSVGCQTASGSQAGCLSSTDWNTFNGKSNSLLGTSTALTAGQVDFSTGVNTIGNSGNFLWNNASNLFTVTGNASTSELTTTGSTYLATVSGNVGIGTTAPVNKLDIAGASAIGADYAGVDTAPTNGLLVEGNVGIGTTNPGALLDVNGAAYVRNILATNKLYGYTNAEIVQIGAGTGTFQFNTISNQSIALMPNGTGNVGIGTTSPDALLSLGSAINTIKVASFDGGPGSMYGMGVGTGGGGELTFGANIAAAGTPQMVLNSSGNVGIGTTAPGQALDVNGAVRALSNTSAFLASYSSGVQAFALNPLSNGAFTLYDHSTGSYTAGITQSGGNVGIGTTSPLAMFSIDVASSTAGTAQGTPFGQLLSMIIGGVRYMVQSFDYYGHLITSGPTPSVSSCGTSPSIQGNDRDFRVYVGSIAATGCTVTFANPYVNAPICVVTPEVGTLTFDPTASSTPTTVVVGGGTITSDVFVGHCEGVR